MIGPRHAPSSKERLFSCHGVGHFGHIGLFLLVAYCGFSLGSLNMTAPERASWLSSQEEKGLQNGVLSVGPPAPSAAGITERQEGAEIIRDPKKKTLHSRPVFRLRFPDG